MRFLRQGKRGHRPRPTLRTKLMVGRPRGGRLRWTILAPELQNPMALMLSNNRILGGVCGGLAEWLGWDPTLVRILYTLLTIFTAFSGLIVYVILWICMPKRPA